jgi:hypothetical protein
MTTSITFIVKETGHSPQFFSAEPFMTLAEVLGADVEANARILRNGQSVNKYMTLAHEHITHGTDLVMVPIRPPKHCIQKTSFRAHPP